MELNQGSNGARASLELKSVHGNQQRDGGRKRQTCVMACAAGPGLFARSSTHINQRVHTMQVLVSCYVAGETWLELANIVPIRPKLWEHGANTGPTTIDVALKMARI